MAHESCNAWPRSRYRTWTASSATTSQRRTFASSAHTPPLRRSGPHFTFYVLCVPHSVRGEAALHLVCQRRVVCSVATPSPVLAIVGGNFAVHDGRAASVVAAFEDTWIRCLVRKSGAGAGGAGDWEWVDVARAEASVSALGVMPADTFGARGPATPTPKAGLSGTPVDGSGSTVARSTMTKDGGDAVLVVGRFDGVLVLQPSSPAAHVCIPTTGWVVSLATCTWASSCVVGAVGDDGSLEVFVGL